MATKAKPSKEQRKQALRRAESGIHNNSDIFEKSFEFEVPEWVKERYRLKFKDDKDITGNLLGGIEAIQDNDIENKFVLKEWDAQRK